MYAAQVLSQVLNQAADLEAILVGKGIDAETGMEVGNEDGFFERVVIVARSPETTAVGALGDRNK